MERIPSTPPQIAPLPEGIIRPFWSVMIPAYNCCTFLSDAIKSVLEQDPGEAMMQIEVVDDCSTDVDVEALVKKIGRGRVSYFRHESNVGSLRNFETCINRAKGYHVHLLHGDDRVKPGFYKNLEMLFKNYPAVGAAFCGWNNINEENSLHSRSTIEAGKPVILKNWLYRLAVRQHIQYVAIVVKREVYERLGAFYGVTYGEDWEMWARIAQYYPMAYTPEILAEYREHQNSISNNSYLSGKNIRDIKKVFSVINSYLPLEKRKKASKTAKRNYAYWALGTTRNLLYATQSRQVVYKQVTEVIKLYADLRVFKMAADLVLRAWIEPYKKHIKKPKPLKLLDDGFE